MYPKHGTKETRNPEMPIDIDKKKGGRPTKACFIVLLLS